MALYMKQDFTPPILSRRWIAIKFRPNMLLYSRQHIITILESGLLFREDSIEVEQEAPSPEEVWCAAGGGSGGWLTRGEGMMAAVALAACVAMFPVKSVSRSSLINVSAYAAIPVAVRASHRALCRGQLPSLLANMRDYIALARRAAACLKEYAALHTQLGSLSSVIESTHTMLCRQQSELSVLMSRASSALLGNAPWLRDDVAWDAVRHDKDTNLTQIHHAFLVVQSTLLKHIAMAHYIPSTQTQKLYKNHNERIYWIHNILIKHLNEEIHQNFESLERMYRLLKNSGNRENETKKLGVAINNNWLYSDIHTGVARVCLELKLALHKSNSLDMFLDSCALNSQELDLNILNKDIDDLIDNITKCLSTVQSSQIRLKKLKGKVELEPHLGNETTEKDLIESAAIFKIDDKVPETKDEVFYFVKTEDDEIDIQSAGDLTTAPGKKEKENTKIVLNELKRKLGKREDVMRERERQALVKTMPELKNIPEFPRQIKFDEYLERKGYISKLKGNIKCDNKKYKLFRNYKIESKCNDKIKKYDFKIDQYEKESDIRGDFLEANAFLNVKSRLITVTNENKKYYIIKWCKVPTAKKEVDSSGMSEGLSDVEVATVNKTVNQAVNVQDLNIKFSKRDLEISASSSASDSEYYVEQRQLLKDVRRHRVARRKNHPMLKVKPVIDNLDESLKPIEYNFGTGLAMASVLQVNNPKFLNMAQEEVFVGDGEVSNDSGNDEDA